MKLYHYSTGDFEKLLTKRATGNVTPEEIKKADEQARRILQPGATYVDHISFFFERIPSDILHNIYGEKHPVWFDGNVLNEYVVDATQFPEKILYEVVESSREVAALDKFTKDHNWVEDDPVLLKKWFAFILNEKVKWGEYGNDKTKLLLQIKRYQGRLRFEFLEAAQREDFQDNFKKYAASVTHLMLYPPTGEVEWVEKNRIVIGKRGIKPLEHKKG